MLATVTQVLVLELMGSPRWTRPGATTGTASPPPGWLVLAIALAGLGPLILLRRSSLRA